MVKVHIINKCSTRISDRVAISTLTTDRHLRLSTRYAAGHSR